MIFFDSVYCVCVGHALINKGAYMIFNFENVCLEIYDIICHQIWIHSFEDIVCISERVC